MLRAQIMKPFTVLLPLSCAQNFAWFFVLKQPESVFFLYIDEHACKTRDQFTVLIILSKFRALDHARKD
jgi:hypothetical protein